MAKKFAAIIILCEDLMHGNFVRHYLLEKGVPPGKIIRINNCPAGKQSGAQYVLQNYPKEVSALRSKHYISQGLVAVIDADTFTVEDRCVTLFVKTCHSPPKLKDFSCVVALTSPSLVREIE